MKEIKIGGHRKTSKNILYSKIIKKENISFTPIF
jgi:hypothetical protein